MDTWHGTVPACTKYMCTHEVASVSHLHSSKRTSRDLQEQIPSGVLRQLKHIDHKQHLISFPINKIIAIMNRQRKCLVIAAAGLFAAGAGTVSAFGPPPSRPKTGKLKSSIVNQDNPLGAYGVSILKNAFESWKVELQPKPQPKPFPTKQLDSLRKTFGLQPLQKPKAKPTKHLDNLTNTFASMKEKAEAGLKPKQQQKVQPATHLEKLTSTFESWKEKAESAMHLEPQPTKEAIGSYLETLTGAFESLKEKAELELHLIPLAPATEPMTKSVPQSATEPMKQNLSSYLDNLSKPFLSESEPEPKSQPKSQAQQEPMRAWEVQSNSQPQSEPMRAWEVQPKSQSEPQPMKQLQVREAGTFSLQSPEPKATPLPAETEGGKLPPLPAETEAKLEELTQSLEDSFTEMGLSLKRQSEAVRKNTVSGEVGRRGEQFVLASILTLACIAIGSVPFIGDMMTLTLGPFLLGGSTFVFLKAFMDLGSNLSPWATPADPESGRGSLVDSGMYSYVRHPIYAALLFGGAGFSVMTDSAMRLILVGVLFIVLDIMSNFEEEKLAETYGAEYENYMSTIPGKFVPQNVMELAYGFEVDPDDEE